MGIFDFLGFGGDDTQATEAATQQTYLPAEFGIPQWDMLEDAYAQYTKPYEPYQGAQVAGFTPDQLNVQNNILGQSMPSTWNQAGGAYTSGLGMIGGTVNQYNAFSPIQTYGESLKYKPVESNSLENLLGYYDFAKYNPATFSSNYNADQFETQSFTEDGVAAQYMNPYIQEALNPTLRQIQEKADLTAQNNAYVAGQAGSFGGSRHGIIDSLHASNTQQELSDVEAEGMARAYDTASQLYGEERTRFLNAFNANETARYNDAFLDLSADQATEQSSQFAAGFGLDQARTRLSADQFDIGNDIQQNQFGATHRLGALQFDSSLGAQTAANQASIGLQGANSYFTGASGLGALSSSYMNSRSAMLDQQRATAQQQQDLSQQLLDTRYTNYLEGRDWDKDQASWFAQMLQSMRVPMESEDYSYDVNEAASPFDYYDYWNNTSNTPSVPSESETPTAYDPWTGESSDKYSSWGFADGGVIPSGIPGAVISQYLER